MSDERVMEFFHHRAEILREIDKLIKANKKLNKIVF